MIVGLEGTENMMLEGTSKLLHIKPKPIWLVKINLKEHQLNRIKINPTLLETFEEFWSRECESAFAD
jgi:hypothetical protein